MSGHTQGCSDMDCTYSTCRIAHAKLKEAAPDLAEALRELVAGCHNGVTLAMLDKAEAALAKAGL